MKVFDFHEAIRLGHRKEWVEWLKANAAKRITLEAFMAAKREFRENDPRLYKSHRYSTSRLTAQYKSLKDEFGFFKL